MVRPAALDVSRAVASVSQTQAVNGEPRRLQYSAWLLNAERTAWESCEFSFMILHPVAHVPQFNFPLNPTRPEYPDNATSRLFVAQPGAGGETGPVGGPISLRQARGRHGQTGLTPDAVLVETASALGYACAETSADTSGYLVALETALTEKLIREGLAREIVRTVQDARKQAGLDVADRIALDVAGDKAVTDAVAAYRDYVATETLVGRWGVLTDATPFLSEPHTLGEATRTIRLVRESTR